MMKLAWILWFGWITATAGEPAKLLPELEADHIDHIAIRYPQGDVVLQRIGQTWVLPAWGNFPVNEVYIAMLLQVLTTADAGEVVSRNPEDLGDYDLDIQVEVFDQNDQSLALVRIGRKGKDYREAHVQRGSEQAIRLVRADFIPAVRRETWGNRWVWRVPESLVQVLNIEGGPQPLHWIRTEDGHWQTTDGAPVDDNLASLYLRRLASWRSGGVRYQPKMPPDWRPTASVTIHAGPAEMTLQLQQRADGVWIGMRDGMPVQFLFSPKFIAGMLEGPLEVDETP